MIQMFGDLRIAARALRRAPGFALAVILTLGIALGANGAMFGIADRLLFSDPSHIVEPDRVFRVLVARKQPSEPGYFPRTPRMSYAAFTDFRDATSSFTNVAASGAAELSLGSGTEARAVATMYASGRYFQPARRPRGAWTVLRGRR